MTPCPRCDAATYAHNTTRIGDLIVRHRKCLNPECGHRFKTTQTPEEVLMEDAAKRPISERVS